MLFERFTECPHGAGIGDVACQFKTEETHERQAVADLVLQALARQVVQALQDEHLEHEHTADGLASGCAFALCGVDAGENGTKHLPVNDGVEPLQRVACFREAGVAVLKVKQAVLHGADVVECLCLF